MKNAIDKGINSMGYEKLYHDNLIDHYKYPRNKGIIDEPSFSSGAYNPSCGDQVNIQGIIKNNKLVQCMFQAKGCVICNAASSLLTENVIDLKIDELLNLDKDLMLNLVKINLGPTRLRCALLPLEALQNGLKEYEKKGE